MKISMVFLASSAKSSDFIQKQLVGVLWKKGGCTQCGTLPF